MRHIPVTLNLNQIFDKIRVKSQQMLAFDTLDHSILLHKLIHYGVCGVENLFYFETIFQTDINNMDFNGSESKTKSISLSVPQGSILGPLLFLIYINDLPRVNHVFKMLMYAEDTTLYCNLNDTNCEIL